MHRFWGILASAVLAAALEVAVKLVADSVAVPRKYYFVPIGAFIVLVGLQLVMSFRDQEKLVRSEKRSAINSTIGGRHLIKGEWHDPSEEAVTSIVILTAACLLTGGLSLIGRYHAEHTGLLITTLCFVVLLAMLCLWVALGSRVSIEFSAIGVAVRRSLGRKRRLRWDEATNFRANSYSFLADPASGSTWYLHGWDLDASDEVICICDLYKAGISATAVNAAIKYWTEVRRQGKR